MFCRRARVKIKIGMVTFSHPSVSITVRGNRIEILAHNFILIRYKIPSKMFTEQIFSKFAKRMAIKKALLAFN